MCVCVCVCVPRSTQNTMGGVVQSKPPPSRGLNMFEQWWGVGVGFMVFTKCTQKCILTIFPQVPPPPPTNRALFKCHKPNENFYQCFTFCIK